MDHRKAAGLAGFAAGVVIIAWHFAGGAADNDFLFGIGAAAVLAAYGWAVMRRV